MLKVQARTIGFFVSAFLGGMAAQGLMAASPAFAGKAWERFFAVADTTNPAGIQSFVQFGATVQQFHDPSGKIRLQLGTYGAKGDSGSPMIALVDDQGNQRVLLTLRGAKQLPVLILRDVKMNDRVVLGLEASGLGEEPFMSTYDASGAETVQFNRLQK